MHTQRWIRQQINYNLQGFYRNNQRAAIKNNRVGGLLRTGPVMSQLNRGWRGEHRGLVERFFRGRPWDKNLIHLNSFALTTSLQGADYQYLPFTDKDKAAWGQHIF